MWCGNLARPNSEELDRKWVSVDDVGWMSQELVMKTMSLGVLENNGRGQAKEAMWFG